MTRKTNCWEFTKCGREPGGANADELGVCLTSIYTQFDGINGGKNGGRVCWAISGTLCNGNVQGALAEKQSYCMACGFYKKLLDELETEESACCF
ncbi:MAG: hypothetical protein HZA14_09765 [Nitrospirae bacterium]|nr:hypothetical protein [Nitrospirota bacterium]